MTFSVAVAMSQSDIDTGEQASCSECPIALAVDRALAKAAIHSNLTEVGANEILVSHNGFMYRAELPKRAQDFISQFDDYGADGVSLGSVPPFTAVFDTVGIA